MIKLHEGNLEQELMSEEEFDNMIETLLISKKNIKKFSKKNFLNNKNEKDDIKIDELEENSNEFEGNIFLTESNIFLD